MKINNSLTKVVASLIVAAASETYLDYYPLVSLVLTQDAWTNTSRQLMIFFPLILLRTLVAVALFYAFNKRTSLLSVSLMFLFFGPPFLLTSHITGNWLVQLPVAINFKFEPIVLDWALFIDFPRLVIVLMGIPPLERFIREKLLRKP